MSGSINKRITKAVTVAKAISDNPEAPFLRQLKQEEGSAAVFEVVLKRCMESQHIPEHIREDILNGDTLQLYNKA